MHLLTITVKKKLSKRNLGPNQVFLINYISSLNTKIKKNIFF